MSRARRYGEDLTYAEFHRNYLPQLYDRVGHRVDLANRDWTEFCHWCKEPLAIHEEVLDRGQDLADKATTVTRKLANRANLPALLVAVRINRSPHHQAQINEYNGVVRLLESLDPIEYFTVRRLNPLGGFVTYSPARWAEFLLLQHRQHHLICHLAQSAIRRGEERPVDHLRLLAASERHNYLNEWQPALWNGHS